MNKEGRQVLEMSPAAWSKAWRYKRLTLELDSGILVGILRDESIRPRKDTPFFLTSREVPLLWKRMRELGEKRLTSKLLERMVREGYVQTWR